MCGSVYMQARLPAIFYGFFFEVAIVIDIHLGDRALESHD